MMIMFDRLQGLENTSMSFVERRVMKPWPNVQRIWYDTGETWFYHRCILHHSPPWLIPHRQLSMARKKWP